MVNEAGDTASLLKTNRFRLYSIMAHFREKKMSLFNSEYHGSSHRENSHLGKKQQLKPQKLPKQYTSNHSI